VGFRLISRAHFWHGHPTFRSSLLHWRLRLILVVDYCRGSVDLWTLVDFWWSLWADAPFGSLCLWTPEVFDFACLLAGLGRLALSRLSTCFASFLHLLSSHFPTRFGLAFESLGHWPAWCFDLFRASTRFVFRLAFRLFGLRLVCSHCLWLWALAVNSLGTLIPALWVQLLPLGFSVGRCILVRHSGTSGRVIVYEDFGSGRVTPLFKGRCSADDLSPLFRIVAQFCIHRLHWFGWGDRQSWGPVELLRDQSERISVVRCGFIESSVVQKQQQSAVLLSLFPRCCRYTQYAWFLTAGLPCHFLWRSSYAPRARIHLPHEFALHAVIGALRELAYLAAYVHIVLVSHEDTTDLDIVISLYCELLILCWDATPIICYHLHVNYVCSYSR